jgi:hypothetical protein
MTDTERPLTGLLQAPSFTALFHSSLEPERVTFQVEGRECWVDLLPLGDDDYDRFAGVGIDYDIDSATGKTTIRQIDPAASKRFLFTRCVQAWSLWTYNRRRKDWELQSLPEDVRQRQASLEKIQLTSEFAGWLHQQCLRINGLGSETEKNSLERSGS